MKRIRRPGYLAGYEPFGKTKGGTGPIPQAPPAEVTQLTPPPAAPAPLPRPVATPTAPAPRPAPRPITLTPAQRADPAFMARIAALQRQVRSGPQARPGVPSGLQAPRPAARPTLPQAEDDDED